MKTEKYYLDKIAKAEAVVQKHKLNLQKFKNPTPLKVPKGKTKIISFRVPVNKSDELKMKIIGFLSTIL